MYPRLNYLRFFLAWSVLAYHTKPNLIVYAGPMAVWCFFTISGYLVSDILYGRYAGRAGDFVMNRVLRIYPTYWAAFLIALFLLYAIPSSVSEVDRRALIPDGFTAWFSSLFIFDMDVFGTPVVPQAWSLSIELNWYLLLFVGSFLPKKWIYILFSVNLMLPFVMRYVFDEQIYKLGTGFAFALGALAYHLNWRAPRVVQLLAITLVPIALYVLPLVLNVGWFNMDGVGEFYFLLGVVVLIYLALPWLTEYKAHSKFANILGDLSYPLFLIQFSGIALSVYFFDLPRIGTPTLIATSAISLVLSIMIAQLVEKPIAVVRTRIRNRVVLPSESG